MNKLSLKTENVLQWIALITIVFSLIGFFHAKYFYNAFGIDVAHYFSLSDYLAVSVTKIYSILLFIFLMILSATAGYFLHKRDIKNGKDVNHPVTMMMSKLNFYTSMLTILFGTFLAYIQNSEMYYYGLVFLILMGCIEIFDFAVKKFSIDLPLYFFIVGAIVYIFLFSASILVDIHKIKNATSVPTMVYIDNNQSNSYAILGANSTYVFLYDRNQSKSFVYPTEKLEHIEIQNPPESNATRVAIMSFVKSGKDYIASFRNKKDVNASK